MNDSSADQLLLDWAKNKAPDWLDEQIHRFSKKPVYVADPMGEMYRKIYAATVEHIRHCGPRIYAVDHEWECRCYSEYTRDDEWVVHTYVRCIHGLVTDMRLVIHDIPEMFWQLADMDDGCVFDDY